MLSSLTSYFKINEAFSKAIVMSHKKTKKFLPRILSVEWRPRMPFWLKICHRTIYIKISIYHILPYDSVVWSCFNYVAIFCSFMFVIKHMVPLCMVISWIYTVAITVQNIVYEKERRLKEFMKMMGLNNMVHWIAWFITSLSTISVTVALLTVILKVCAGIDFKFLNRSCGSNFLLMQSYCRTIPKLNFIFSGSIGIISYWSSVTAGGNLN